MFNTRRKSSRCNSPQIKLYKLIVNYKKQKSKFEENMHNEIKLSLIVLSVFFPKAIPVSPSYEEDGKDF